MELSELGNPVLIICIIPRMHYMCGLAVAKSLLCLCRMVYGIFHSIQC